jgi:hypothetical protein
MIPKSLFLRSAPLQITNIYIYKCVLFASYVCDLIVYSPLFCSEFSSCALDTEIITQKGKLNPARGQKYKEILQSAVHCLELGDALPSGCLLAGLGPATVCSRFSKWFCKDTWAKPF